MYKIRGERGGNKVFAKAVTVENRAHDIFADVCLHHNWPIRH